MDKEPIKELKKRTALAAKAIQFTQDLIDGLEMKEERLMFEKIKSIRDEEFNHLGVMIHSDPDGKYDLAVVSNTEDTITVLCRRTDDKDRHDSKTLAIREFNSVDNTCRILADVDGFDYDRLIADATIKMDLPFEPMEMGSQNYFIHQKFVIENK